MIRRLYLLLFVVVLVAAAARLPVMFDEAYYWTWSKTLGASYYDHPPLTAWIIAGFRAFLGDGRLALRALSLGCSFALVSTAVATTYRSVPAERRHRAGWILVVTMLGALMFVVGYLPATPDVVQGCWLAIAAYAVVRAYETGGRWSFIAAWLLTAGVLVKHSTALVAVGVLIALLSSARGRARLLRPAPWLGVLVGGLCLVPWLLADVDGATSFQLTRVLENSATRGITAVPLTVGAMLLSLGLPATVALFIAVSHGGATRVLAGGAMGVVAGCIFAAWFGTGEVNWVMPALAFGAPAAVATAASTRWSAWYERITWATSVVWLVLLAHVVLPFLPIPPAKDRTLRAAGFDAVAQQASALAERYGAVAIVARRYQIASMMRYHLADEWPVYELGTSRKSQYDRWPRPAVCASDVVIVVLPSEAIPFAATPLESTTWVTRARGGRTLDRYAVTPVRVTAAFDSCAVAGRRGLRLTGGDP